MSVLEPCRARLLARIAALLIAWPGCAAQLDGAAAPGVAQSEPSRIELLVADADLWAFRVRLEGRLHGEDKLANCHLEGSDRRTALTTGEQSFFGDAMLAPGLNRVRARCRTRAGRDLQSQSVRLTVRLRAAPSAHPTATVVGDELVLDAAASRAAEHAPAVLLAYEWTLRSRATAVPASATPLGSGLRLRVPAPRGGVYEVWLRVVDALGRSDDGGVLVDARKAPAQLRGPGDAPPWLAGAVLYGVPPALYGRPPFQALRAALPELAALGITALWLSPVYVSPPGDFGYAVVDGLAIRPDYGSEKDLHQLIEDAHRHGLRVLFDLVPNHTSARHPYFVQSERLGPRSHYYGFYQRDEAGTATHYFDWDHLPNLAYGNPEVRRFVTETALHWATRFDVDGYRVDVAWGVERRAPGFFRGLSAELRREKPDLALLAESSARDADFVAQGFDMAYDWTAELGHWAWEGVFSEAAGVAQRLHEAVLATSRAAVHPERVLRFLNNNDTGRRFITKHGEPMTRVATAALLTLPGVPCLYAFDEVGGEFEPYAQAGPLHPAPRPGLREWHERWIALRKTLPALHGSGFEPLSIDAAHDSYAYLRYADAPQPDAAIVVLNFGLRPALLHLRIPPAFQARFARGAHELHTARRYPVRGGALRIDAPAHSARVLAPVVHAAQPGRAGAAPQSP